MNKKEELELLDDLYRKFIIEQLQNGTLDIKDASQVVQYLRSNNHVMEKETKGGVDEEVRRRVKEAEERRKSK